MNVLGIFLLLCIARLGTSRNVTDVDSTDIAVPAGAFDVTKFGAVGDGVTDNSIAFGRLWAQVCEATKGNPTLFFPPGNTFLLQPVIFSGPCKSRQIQVQIEGNIVAPSSPSAWAGLDRRFWISFQKVDGLTVSGNGQIDGQGAKWWKTSRNGHTRPTALSFYFCNNLRINGLKSINSQRNHITIYNCHNAFISNVQIIAPALSPNTDGIDIAHSSFVHISNCFIRTGDDCIAIKTGCSNINITEIQCGPGHGISVGSLGGEKPALVEQVNVRNCNFTKTLFGVRIKSVQGGQGYARKITFQDIFIYATYYPIIIDQNYHWNSNNFGRSDSDVKISDVSFIGVRGSSSGPVAIRLKCSTSVGCTNIRLNNVHLFPADKTKTVVAECLNAHGTAYYTYPQVTCLQRPLMF